MISQTRSGIPGELLFLRSSRIRGFASITACNQLKEHQLLPIMRDAGKEVIQFCKALLYIEFATPRLLIQPQHIQNTIKTINKILFPENGGEYRSHLSIVFRYEVTGGEAGQSGFNRLDAFYGQDPQWKTSTRQKVLDNYFTHPKVKQHLFEPQDLACIEKAATIIPPDEVASRMAKLETLTEEDCYERAAKVHQLIVETHPFPDKNGTTARLAMNLVLLAADKELLVIESLEDYIQAVKGEYFAGYIRAQAAKQPKCDPGVSLALRNIVFMTALKEFYTWE